MKQDAALLVTDLVDSTLLTEQLGDEAMSAVWQAHDRISRDLLVAWNGKEINRSDGFLLRFERASDAAAYAVALHRAIGALSPPLRARAALHVGPVVARENLIADQQLGAKSSELAGLAIAMASRVMALAQARQTLMTDAARAAIGPTTLRVVSHGYWRLKGVEEAIELHEIGENDAPFSLPPDAAKCYAVARRGFAWVPRREVPNSLPGERNAFVNRHAELRALTARLEADERLITIVGPGGVGKTRFVQQVGWRHLGAFGGGVWFCDLSQATTFDGLCGAVAQGLRLPLGHDDPAEQIGNALAARGDCLVILDNFEQIVRHGGDSVGRWLDSTIDARFLVTTRNVLHIDGEAVVELSPLANEESKELFAIRARAARHSFHLDAKDEQNLTDLVRLLDGLPLAIELAAARVRVLPVAGLLERMKERFSLLASDRGRSSRQTTLKATLDWSWDLLDESERSALAQVSVFEGGFDVPGYEAIVVPEPPQDVLRVLQSLVDKSWVQRVDDDRFALLKSVQEYAAFALAERVEASAAMRRHWVYYGSLDDRAAGAHRCIEVENLISATRRAIAADLPSEASACLLSSWWAVRRCGPFRSTIDLGNRVRAMTGLSATDRARVEFAIGNAWRHTGVRDEAERAFNVALEDARAAGATREESWILAAIGEQHTQSGQWARAQQSFDEALSLARQDRDRTTECAVLNSVGAMLQASDRAAESFGPYQEALGIARSLGDAHLEGGILGNLGGAFYSIGRLDEAEEHFVRAIALVQSAGNRRWEGNMRCNLGLVYLDRGDLPRAIGELETAVAEARQLGHLRLGCIAMWNLGLAHQASGNAGQALLQFVAASDIARSRDDRTSLATLLALSAPLAVRSWGLDESRPILDEARRLTEELGDFEGLAAVHCARTLGEAAAGRIEEARSSLTQARNAALRLDARSAALEQLLTACEATVHGSEGSSLLMIGSTTQ